MFLAMKRVMGLRLSVLQRNPAGLIVLLLGMAIPAIVWSQATTEEAEAPSASPVTAAAVQERLKQVNASETGDAAAKQPTIDKLQKAIDVLTQVENLKASIDTYRNSITNAPVETKALQATYEEWAAKGPETIAEAAESWSETPVAELDAQLVEPTARLSDLNTRVDATRADVTSLETRPTKLATDLEGAIAAREALRAQGVVEVTSSTLVSELTPDEIVKIAELRKANLQIEALEQERVSLEARLTRARARLKALEEEKRYYEQFTEALQRHIQERRQAEAIASQKASAERLRQAANEHEVVARMALKAKNAADAVVALNKKITDLRSKDARLSDRLEELKERRSEMETQLELGGRHRLVAELLIDERQYLESETKLPEPLGSVKRDLVATQLEKNQTDIEERNLPEPKAEAQRILEGAELSPSQTELSEPLLASLTQLVSDRNESIRRLDTAYDGYSGSYEDYLNTMQEFILERRLFAAELEKNQIWAPNKEPVNLKSFVALGKDVINLVNPTRFLSGIDRAAKPFRWAVSYLMGLAAVSFILYRRRPRIQKDIETFSKKVNRISTDNIKYTFRAIFATALWTAPMPLFLFGASLALQETLGANSAWRAISSGLFSAGALFWAIAYVDKAFDPQGLAIQHFRWNRNWVKKFGERFDHIAGAASFVVAIVVAFNWKSLRVFGDELDRWSLIAGGLLTLVFLMRILRKGRQPVAEPKDSEPPEKRRNFGWVTRLLFGVAPVLFMALAVSGYLYTAYFLAERLMLSLGLFGLGVVGYELLGRWFYIRERKIALRQALEKRKALREAKHEEPGTHIEGESPGQEFDEDSVDVGALAEQTRRLCRTLVGLVFLLSLWGIWSAVFPALSGLDKYTIVGVISARDLVIGLLIGVYTVLAAKNLPGALETGILQNLPLQPGTRYAIVNLCQYAVVAIGFFSATIQLGVPWEELGWVFAAFSVGLGFGLQEIISNFICGMILLFERPIRVGDVVTVSDVTGVISRIRIRATTVTNWDQQDFIIPNKEFVTGRVLNWTYSSTVNRVVINVGIAYGSDVELARKTLFEIAAANRNLLENPAPNVTFEALGDSSLNLVLRCYLPALDNRLATINDLNTAIHSEFRRKGIEIPFPQRDIHIRTEPVRIESSQAPQG